MQNFDEALKNQLDNILDSTYDGIYILDRKGTFIRINISLERICGVSREDYLGLNALDLARQGVIDPDIYQRITYTKETITEVQILTFGDRVISVLVTATPILDKAGEILYIVGNVRDIRELLQLQTWRKAQQEVLNLHITGSVEEIIVNEKIIAHSNAMKIVLEMVSRAALVDSSILLEGDSGTGKEVIAGLIHKVSGRCDKPFVTVNCAAIPEHLLESELFGYKAGSFSGASKDGKKGLIETANGGTLFLDEINSLPLSLQGKILRVIETKEITAIGSTRSKRVDFRLISASNGDLYKMTEAGFFRKDLYYRLKVIPIFLPALTERTADIVPLTIHFLENYNFKYSRNKEISSDTFTYLENYHWPGNVRELKNVVERLVVISASDIIRPFDLPGEFLFDQIYDNPEDNDIEILIRKLVPLGKAYRILDEKMIAKAIKEQRSIVKAAAVLEIDPSTIHRKISKGYNIK